MNENLDKLFQRIEYPKQIVQFSDLPLLMKQFAYHLPFENVDIMINGKTLLEYDALYHKMIHNKRGGLCYELNPLLFYTLQELGFDVQMIHATIMVAHNPLEDTHISTILKHENQLYLVEVGFGANQPLQPVPFTGEFVYAPSGSYRIIRDADPNYFLFEKYIAGELAISYKFSLAETDDSILYRAKELTETHESSKFNKGLLLTLTTPEGHLTATDTTFTRVVNEEKEKESIDQHQLFSISRTFFDINLVELGYSGNEV
ncbi:MAG TPA: arylamine N-acetyltransferase [Pseudogracilibacillus sp.]|nr:arylamine N-acetyltransferase [Pseudogracilibacillus sp.]